MRLHLCSVLFQSRLDLQCWKERWCLDITRVSLCLGSADIRTGERLLTNSSQDYTHMNIKSTTRMLTNTNANTFWSVCSIGRAYSSRPRDIHIWLHRWFWSLCVNTQQSTIYSGNAQLTNFRNGRTSHFHRHISNEKNTCYFLQVLVRRQLNASGKRSIYHCSTTRCISRQLLKFHFKRKSNNKEWPSFILQRHHA